MCFLIDGIPGKFEISRGVCADYRSLERFHYLARSPATWAAVWVVRYQDKAQNERVVAAGVLSYPTVQSAARDAALGLADWAVSERLKWVNAHIRTISRIVVHPQFRSLGLARRLVHTICEQCNTRCVEAYAQMGRVHPFFENGGMKRMTSQGEGAVYFLFDRARANDWDCKDVRHE